MQQHPLKVTEVTKTGRREVLDMERINDLFYDKEIFTKIIQGENPMSPSYFFSRIAGGSGGAFDEMFEPVAEGISAEFIKILEVSTFQEPLRIVDVSQVPDTLWAGMNFQITLDKASADGDETLMGRDETTTFRTESRRPGVLGVDYTIQYIGIPGTSISGSFLRKNDPLHTGYGNSKGQGSMNSNTLVDDSEKRTQFFNMSNIIRYGFTQTGSAAADEMYKFAVTTAMDGSTTKDVTTDMPVRIMRKVMWNLDNALMSNVPNFNPRTKEIANRTAMGRYHERPYFAGLNWQLDQCPWKWTHALAASMDEGVQKLDFILNFMNNKLGRKVDLWAMCSGIGREWLKKVILQGGLKKYGVNLMQVVTGGDKLKIGFDSDEYITSHGRILVYDIGQAMTRWNEFDTASYGGITYRPRSKFIYFIPSYLPGPNGKKKKPAHIYYKEGNGHSRAMAFGYQNGITGEGAQGFTGDQLLAMQDQFIARNMRNERYRMDSTVDGKEFHVLMHLVPYIDVRYITRLELR